MISLYSKKEYSNIKRFKHPEMTQESKGKEDITLIAERGKTMEYVIEMLNITKEFQGLKLTMILPYKLNQEKFMPF